MFLKEIASNRLGWFCSNFSNLIVDWWMGVPGCRGDWQGCPGMFKKTKEFVLVDWLDGWSDADEDEDELHLSNINNHIIITLISKT